MSDNKTNVARMPNIGPPVAKMEIDFPSMIMMCIEKGLDPQVIVTMFQNEKDRQHKEALDTIKADIYGEMLPVLKDKENTHLKNRYATIPAMMVMLQPILKNYGVFVGFECGMLPGEPPVAEGCIRVRIAISYGGYTDRASYLDEPISKGGVRGGITQMNDQQAITSATTYAARTLLKLKFNVIAVEDDDDAEGARETEAQRREREAAQRKTDEETRRAANPPDGATLFPSVAKNLARATTVANVDSLAANEQVVKFRALQTPANQALIDKMIADRRAALVTATTGDLPDDLDMNGDTAASTKATDQSTDAAGALIGRVNICHTQDEITQIINEPVFVKSMADLFPPDRDVVTAAIERRRAQVGTT